MVTDVVDAYNVCHVIDLCPTPLCLGAQLASRGCSYVAVCATLMMKEYLQGANRAKIKAGILDPEQRILYDPRFANNAGCFFIFI